MTSKPVIYVGIDPGQSGGIAWVTGTGYGAIPMPDTRKQVHDRLYDLTFDYFKIVAVVEKVASRPGQGVASMFKFGKHTGELLGVLTALHAEILEPTPQAWKKEMLAGTDKGKDASIQVCENLFPEINLVPPRCRKPHDGMAEAMLLAEYGRRQRK